MNRTRLAAVGAATAVALLTALLYGLPASGQAVPEAERARGYAYGLSALGGQEPQIDGLPEVEADAPPPPPQAEVKRINRQDIGVNVGPAQLLVVQSDACLDTGASAKLQADINEARILERGGTPARDANTENEGPDDEDPERVLVRYPVGFPGTARCVAPANSNTPIQGPTPTAPPTPTPTPTASPTGTPTGTPAPPPTCEAVVTNPNAANFSPVCLAKAPLWNARGYARAANVLTFEEIEAEAVARCTADGQAVVATAADYDLTANVGPDVVTRPNQPLDPAQLGLVRVSAVTFWETNWDPINMTTTDGSDTVWVNGMHIVTSTGRDIIVSRAEAKVECPGEEPTETVTPTDTETPEIPAACRPTPGNEPSGEIILGTNGPDAIAGTPRDDIICALDGDDLVDALDGDDLVILGRGDDEAEGGGGKDTIHGDEGNDSMSGGLFHDLLIGGAGDDQMKGNRGIDTLRGNKGADTLQGGAADDVLRGGSGNDSLRGYNGDDLLNGDKGVDQCIPGRGRDIMRNCERVRQPR